MTTRPEAYVTYPGLSNHYNYTADLNLLDADTAHTHQAQGNWSPNTGTLVRSTDYALFGDGSLKAVPTSAYAVIKTPTWGTNLVSASTEYTYSVWVRVSGVRSGMTLRTEMQFYTGAGAATGAYHVGSFVAVVEDDWVQLSVTATSAADAASVRLYVTSDTNAPHDGVGVFYLDKICLRAGSSSSFVPSLRIVGDLDLRIDLSFADLSSGEMDWLGTFAFANGGFGLYGDANIRLWFGDGTGYQFDGGKPHGLSSDQRGAFRCTRIASSGIVEYFLDSASLGTNNPPAGPLAPSSDHGVNVGRALIVSTLYGGDVWSAEVRDGIDGPVVARLNPEEVRVGQVVDPPDAWIQPLSAPGLLGGV